MQRPMRNTKRPEYNVWVKMRFRCRNPKDSRYADYGGRGITVCDRWDQSFENFLADMGERPSKKHSIDRIDNNGNYEPGNCLWVLPMEQQRNRSDNVRLTHEGTTLTVVEWAGKIGINPNVIYMRLSRGWSICRALSTPLRNVVSTKGKMITAFGQTRTISDWARVTGICRGNIARRISRGWPAERALAEGWSDQADSYLQ